MSERNDGGPAFPLDVNADTSGTVNVGMSLRDYFAAAALQGICAANVIAPKGMTPSECIRMFGRTAYELADALLSERNK